MKECICKIKNRKGKGTGFFCIYNNIKLFITNNHVIDEEIIKENNNILVSINDEENEEIIIKINNKKIYTNKKYDVTIIEIQEEKIKNYIELDKDIFKENINMCNENIYIVQYPEYQFNEQKACVSYGQLKEIQDEYNIIHLCSTKVGSSGSPILNIKNNKVIGIHKGNSEKYKYKKGTFLKKPINEYLNNLNIIKKEIKEELNANDINNENKKEEEAVDMILDEDENDVIDNKKDEIRRKRLSELKKK